MSYETEKHKLNVTIRKSNTNKNHTEDLSKYNLTKKPEQILKKPKIIHLRTKDYITMSNSSSSVSTFDLVNFPDWCIPFTKVIPKLYFDDGDIPVYNELDAFFEGLFINTEFKYVWVNLGVNNWQLRVETYIYGFKFSGPGDFIGYLDIDLVINNEFVWEENNPNKN